MTGHHTVLQASAVALDGRALLLEGPPASGKSSLALALIDRGAELLGDDGVTLTQSGSQVIVAPPPNIAGMLEIRGIGLVTLPIASPTPLALILSLVAEVETERLPDVIPTRRVCDVSIPILKFAPVGIAPAARAEWALRQHGLCTT